MPKRKLTREQQAFVVQALACFDSPKVVALALKKEFDVDLTPQAVEGYDPTKRAGRHLAKKWHDLFTGHRKEFLEKAERIPYANRAVRLRTIQRAAEKAEEMGNLAMLLQCVEQAAKEVGEAYTNRREFSGPGGKPLEYQAPTLAQFYGQPRET